MRSIPTWPVALALVLLAGATLRAARAINHGAFLSTDERAYAALGLGLSRGDYAAPNMEDPLHWPPGTPLLFAVARQLSGGGSALDPIAAYWAQAAVGVALIVAVFLLAQMIAGPWAGVGAAAAVALYPPLVVITGDLVSEPLGALALALVMVALAWAWRAPSPWRFALAGAAAGAAILVRADVLVLPFVLAALVALSLRREGARTALLSAAAYLVAAAIVLAPWSVYATTQRSELTVITTSSWSTLFVGTYLPAGGRTYELRRVLGDEARARNPRIRHIPNEKLRAEWILDAVAARHPELGRTEALKRESLNNLRRYALGRPLDYAGMQLAKLERMWIGYDRGSYRSERGWILAVHLAVCGAGLAGLLIGLWRTRHPVLWAILLAVLTGTAVNTMFVSQARHNAPLVPLLVAGGAAGLALALTHRRPRRTQSISAHGARWRPRGTRRSSFTPPARDEGQARTGPA